MVWRKEVDDNKRRHELVKQGGLPERIQRQHENGKLTVRERIDILADKESFREIGGLAGRETYDGDELVGLMPGGVLVGWCTLNGRKVLIHADDSTVRYDMPAGGTVSTAPRVHRRGSGYGEIVALHARLPYIRLLDAPGASVRSYEMTGRPEFVSTNQWIQAAALLLPVSPVVSAVLGAAAGKPAIDACLCHFNVIVKGKGQVFPGGPPVVKAALGYTIHKEDLGGSQVVAYNGVVDNVAEDEQEAFRIVRQFLSYLPDNVWEMTPRADPGDDPGRRDEELLSAVPRDTAQPYDPHKIVNHVVDRGSFFEIGALSGQSTITALARVNGWPVGVIIRNPGSSSRGAMDVVAGDKVVRLLRLCDTFHLPVVCFVDDLGLMVGPDSERQGIARTGARLVQAIYETRVPWISFLVRQVYPLAGGMTFRPHGMFKRYAWPSANWTWTDAAGSTLAPYRAADAFTVEDIIDPRDTRPLLCEFVEAAQPILRTQLGPSTGPSYQL